MEHGRRGTAWRATAGTAALLSACGGQPDRSGALVRDSAGVAIVQNEVARPIWTEGAAWSVAAEPTVSIGTADGDSVYLIHNAYHTRRLRDGSVAVANMGTSDARLFDARGQHLRTLGRAGDGPGEFRTPWAVFDGPADSVVVVDLYRKVAVYGRDGGFGRQLAIDGDEVAQDVFGDGSLLMMAYAMDQEAEPADGWIPALLLRRTLDGAPPTPIRAIDERRTTGGGPNSVLGPVAGMAAGDSTVWYSRGDALALEESAADGRLLRIVRLNLPPVALDEAAKDRIVTRLAERTSADAADRMVANATWPEVLPAHGPVIVDDGGHVWVQAYAAPGPPQPSPWYLFRPDGRFLGTVATPAGLAVHHIGRDFVLGVHTDEFDVQRLRLYHLIKPEAQ